MNAGTHHKWLKHQALLLLLSAVALLAVFENTRLDVTLALLLYDPALHDFPLHNHWFFTKVLHHGLKTAAYVLGAIAVFFCLFAMRGKIPWLPRRNAALAATGMLLIPITISALKHITNRHCPWDVVEFGGYAPYIGLFTSTPEGIIRGSCFPAGHSAGGFVWIIWAVALASTRPKLARSFMYGALVLGTIMGGARMIQGAHFLSHTLWSLWIAWAISVVLAMVFRIPVTPSLPVIKETEA